MALDGLIGQLLTGFKQGLIETAKNRGFEGEGYSYLTNPIWWAGMITSTVPYAAFQ